jgi:hypothetical protein
VKVSTYVHLIGDIGRLADDACLVNHGLRDLSRCIPVFLIPSKLLRYV